jgi:homoserine O-acetyltransferase
VYCGWAYSQAFYREALWRELGFATLDELLSFWEADHLEWDANDLLAKLRTWHTADVGKWRLVDGGYEQALSSIKAQAIVMPSRTDLYFTPEDSAVEVQYMPHAELRVIESDWGHCAGGPGREDAAMRQLGDAVDDLFG